MSEWRSTRAGHVLAALRKIGWSVKRQAGSHRVLCRQGWQDVVFAFHDGDEIGPRMLARIAKHTGLRPEDLRDR
ncbi:MAG: type II toxin-antitoxin system HicA family toxin [Anaerosomatales bacterium]|nr:type II toxin-antitoxin system HicA family toxin [Coriobacteriia bacterium]MDI6692283.1 type II toxin-antitoxin system HicA family toxin [Anaerosomatales bacterium]MDI6843427.1 type II toxin-antitoxin system HicA family toxin [Anaerosomatales bacterium]